MEGSANVEGWHREERHRGKGGGGSLRVEGGVSRLVMLKPHLATGFGGF